MTTPDLSHMAIAIVLGLPDQPAPSATIEFPGGLSKEALDALSNALPSSEAWSLDTILEQARLHKLQAVSVTVNRIRWTGALDELSRHLDNCVADNACVLDVVGIAPRVMVEFVLTDVHPDEEPELFTTFRALVPEHNVAAIKEALDAVDGKIDPAAHKLVELLQGSPGRRMPPMQRLLRSWDSWLTISVVEGSRQ